MDDLISRQAAIDAIERLILPQVKGETAAEEINRVAWRCAINCAEEMIGHLPSAERHGRWIPCSERMPEKRGTYLASTNMGDVGLAECDWDYEDGMYWSAEYLDVDGIVAWMELPEPYREDKG